MLCPLAIIQKAQLLFHLSPEIYQLFGLGKCGQVHVFYTPLQGFAFLFIITIIDAE